jgi:hypothetical protein
MNAKKENNTLTIFLEGRSDAQNAAETEKAIFAAVQEAPDAELVLDSVRLSMGMDVDAAFAMYRRTIETYLGATDLAGYEQSMQLLSMFHMLLYLAKGKDSKNLTPERVQGLLGMVLPQFRQYAPMIMNVVKNF